MGQVKAARNRKTIIVGEVNTGKTAYLSEIVNHFKEDGETDIAVIDMAPYSVKGIGGKMNKEAVEGVRYFSAQVAAPRLMGRNEDEVENLADSNAKSIEAILLEYEQHPAKALFINDVSLYLQAGDLKRLISALRSTPTVVMNGYYGHSLGGGKLGRRERRNMEALQKKCDTVITL